MRRIAAVAAFTMLAVLPAHVPAGSAEPEPQVVVQAGAVSPADRPSPYEYTTYYPRGADNSSTARVHRGGIVEWRFPGFHSVTFLPGDLDDAHPSWFRADEAPGIMAVNEAWWTATQCGRAGQPVCVVDGYDESISSGAPIFNRTPFRARIDVPAGTSLRYHCTIHPAMHGHIQVVANSTPLPSQTDIEAQIEREVREDTAKADALLATKATSRVDNGVRVWTVLVGSDTADRTVHVIGYLGANADGTTPLRVAPGDDVEFVSRGADPHTVTFPAEAIGAMGIPPAPGPPYGLGGMRATPRCEVDAPAGGAPGIPFSAAPIIGCPVGQIELTFSPWMTRPDPVPGNVMLTPATYADSGLMLPADAPASARTLPTTPVTHLASAMRVSFPNTGTFTYGCNLHTPLMFSSVVVR